ncbi:MAG: hypothetical protein NWE89_12615 [Candidatus Bathyarchaeota archaeon]|nr:hypothetical protein [Candidatus Bathyarchaeota archaeon]
MAPSISLSVTHTSIINFAAPPPSEFHPKKLAGGAMVLTKSVQILNNPKIILKLKVISMPPKPFPPIVAESLLVKSNRRCCLCRTFKGTKIEIHHIEPDGGNDEDNGIPLCFDCHADVGSYNPNHPKGRKYTPSELKKHRDQWFDMVSKVTFIQDITSNSPLSIDEFPQGSSWFNVVSSLIEKYSQYVYDNQTTPLIKEKIIMVVLFVLFETPIFYAIYFNRDILTGYPTYLGISIILGLIPLSILEISERTRCEVCNNIGSLEYFESKLIKEDESNDVVSKVYDVDYKCKSCGVILNKIERKELKKE